MVALGQTLLSSLSGTDRNSRLCNEVYEVARDEMLASFDWAFARKRKAVPASSETNLTEYDYMYTLPNDFLVMRSILDSEAFSETEEVWEVEGEYLLTDVSPCYIKYTSRLENAAKYPALFCKSLGLNIAERISENVTQNKGIWDRVAQKAAIALLEAKATLAPESKSRPAETGNWSEV